MTALRIRQRQITVDVLGELLTFLGKLTILRKYHQPTQSAS
jgi:hypothetical protein